MTDDMPNESATPPQQEPGLRVYMSDPRHGCREYPGEGLSFDHSANGALEIFSVDGTVALALFPAGAWACVEMTVYPTNAIEVAPADAPREAPTP